MEIANGEENGWKFRVYLDAPQWIAEVISPDGEKQEKKWNWAFEPRCGPDVLDVAIAEEKLNEMLPPMEIDE